ncbi:hypothetical protein GCM10010399_38860 [Dactylosporangium fulvum]|uniref:DUF4034 domain-containing protein n=1 Tax=Dactylosporangium fulvum TaxID=53359 RepID=A0ABY5W405_9ACTN|nr:hypothetical protein [Dactylosporangium fulvum]UWP84267.1 hypothetical protein Dfulv_08515 [Dactylosporangium fulvum]
MALDLAFSDEVLEKALRMLADDADPQPALELIAAADDVHRKEHAVEVLGVAGQRHLDLLRDLADRQPYGPERWLLLGASLAAAAWTARGTADGEHTSHRQLRDQEVLVGEARRALRRAAALNLSDPVPWSELAGVVLGAPLYTSEPTDVFKRAMILAPDLYRAHTRYLAGLTNKWYGSQERVLAFARTRVAERPDGHPFLALIALAHIEGYVDGLLRGTVITRFWRAWRYFADAAIRLEVDAASDRLLAGAAAFADHPWTITAHQTFAALYHQANVPGRARPHLRLSGTRPAVWPWRYFGDPERLFAAAVSAGS